MRGLCCGFPAEVLLPGWQETRSENTKDPGDVETAARVDARWSFHPRSRCQPGWWLLNQDACGTLIGTGGCSDGGPTPPSASGTAGGALSWRWPLPPCARRHPWKASAAEDHIGWWPVSTSGRCHLMWQWGSLGERRASFAFQEAAGAGASLEVLSSPSLGSPGHKTVPLTCVELFRSRVRPEGAC